MTDDFDDFEEIERNKTNLAPCTLRCGLVGREGRRAKRVSVTFRTGKLDPEIVKVLANPTLSAAYSPSQRVVRVKADPRGEYRLTLAPRADDVYLLRFPYPEKMPWVDRRVAVELDVNVEQGAIFIEIPGVTPERQVALPAPNGGAVAAIAPPTPVAERLADAAIPARMGSVELFEHEAAVLHLLANGRKHNKTVLGQVLVERGYGEVKMNALVGRLRQKLETLDIELTESTDKSQIWLAPMALAALERAVRAA